MTSCPIAQKARWLFIFLVCPLMSYGHPGESDSLKHRLKRETVDSLKVDILIRLSTSRTISQDSSFFYAHEALGLARSIGYERGLAQSYRALISFAKDTNEIDSLVALSRTYFRRTNRPQDEWLPFITASSRKIILGNDVLAAFRNVNLFLKNYHDANDRESYAVAWNLVGEIYRSVRNFDKARAAYLASTKYASLNGKILFLSPFINLGTIHLELGNLDSAFAHYDFIEQHLVRSREENSNTFAYIKYRKAQVFLAQRKFAEAKRQAIESLDRYVALRHEEGQILSEGALCEVFFGQHFYRAASLHGTNAVNSALKTNYMINGVDRICHMVSRSRYELNDLRGALYYADVENRMKEIIYNPSVSSELANAVLALEAEKQGLAHQLMHKQMQATQLKIREERSLKLFAVSGLVMLSGISFLLYRSGRTKHKLNLQLREKQNEIMAQTEELSAQAEELKASNEKMESVNANLEGIVTERTMMILDQNKKLRDFAYFNAHQVRGPLARILGLITIMEMEFNDTNLRRYLQMIRASGDELDRMVSQINSILEEGTDS